MNKTWQLIRELFGYFWKFISVLYLFVFCVTTVCPQSVSFDEKSCVSTENIHKYHTSMNADYRRSAMTEPGKGIDNLNVLQTIVARHIVRVAFVLVDDHPFAS